MLTKYATYNPRRLLSTRRAVCARNFAIPQFPPFFKQIFKGIWRAGGAILRAHRRLEGEIARCRELDFPLPRLQTFCIGEQSVHSAFVRYVESVYLLVSPHSFFVVKRFTVQINRVASSFPRFLIRRSLLSFTYQCLLKANQLEPDFIAGHFNASRYQSVSVFFFSHWCLFFLSLKSFLHIPPTLCLTFNHSRKSKIVNLVTRNNSLEESVDGEGHSVHTSTVRARPLPVIRRLAYRLAAGKEWPGAVV